MVQQIGQNSPFDVDRAVDLRVRDRKMRVRREKDEQGSLGKVWAMEIASRDACVERDVFKTHTC